MSNEPLSGREPSLHETVSPQNEPVLGGDHWVAHYAPLLDNPQPRTRVEAVTELARLNSKSTIVLLCRALQDEAQIVRRSAVQALLALGERFPAEILNAMERVRKSRDTATQLAAMVVIYRLTRDPAWLAPMAKRLQGQYFSLLDLVTLDSGCLPVLLRLEGNSRYPGFDYAITQMGLEVVPTLVAALEDESTRERAIRLLTLWSPMEAMVELSRSPDPTLRGCAVRVIAGYQTQDREQGWFWFGHNSWYEPVLARMLELANEPLDLETQRYVITVLANWRSTRAGYVLRRYLQSDEPSIRELAVWALGEIQDRYALPLLRVIVRDERGHIRRKAITALRQIGDPSAAPEIIRALDDPTGGTRKEAIKALAAFSTAEAVAALIDVMQGKDHHLARFAAKRFASLNGHGLPEAVSVLIRALLIPKVVDGRRICDLAAQMLRRLGTAEALAAVEQWEHS